MLKVTPSSWPSVPATVFNAAIASVKTAISFSAFLLVSPNLEISFSSLATFSSASFLAFSASLTAFSFVSFSASYFLYASTLVVETGFFLYWAFASALAVSNFLFASSCAL